MIFSEGAAVVPSRWPCRFAPEMFGCMMVFQSMKLVWLRRTLIELRVAGAAMVADGFEVRAPTGLESWRAEEVMAAARVLDLVALALIPR